ncbi:uncharacterized protein C5orf52 homolog [Numida meleagris]|uniref:uncharacterized protein C5orf52 homolog n=1 Tax=Numida meleagris TaxID=8996 RepID=UPI000B3DDD48|nr:uncharacterized protein C5orf52 homolog [Numida meleagris]
MEELGGVRPCVTFFPPPESREPTRACCVDVDIKVGDQELHSSLSRSAGSSSHHALLLLEKKVKQLEETKKKIEHHHKQLRQQFVKEQERKTARWKKASERFEKSLEVFSRRGRKPPVPAAGGQAPSKGT